VTNAVSAALGRVLLQSSIFTRHVVIDRWFLRTGGDEPLSAELPAPLPH
jgi:hypothetical protein